MGKRAVRIVKSRGKEYAQEVEYKWDPDHKKSKTVFIRQLGPVNPSDKSKYKRTKLHNSKRDSVYQKRKVGKKGRSTIINSQEMIHKVPGKLAIDTTLFKQQVLEVLKESQVPLSRKDVARIIKEERLSLSMDYTEISTTVGFTLTVLERGGTITKQGKGRKGEPYLYSV